MIGLELVDFSSPLMPLIVALIGGIVGDNTFIVLGFMHAQDFPDSFLVFLSLFFGIVFFDLFYYYVGRSKWFEKTKKIKIIGKIFGRVDSTIDLMTGKHVNLAFFYCKFLTGAKFVVNAYLGKKGVSFWRFFSRTLLAALVWSTIAFLVGYYSGKGFNWILALFESLSLGFLFLGILLALFYKFSKKTKNYFNKKINPSK